MRWFRIFFKAIPHEHDWRIIGYGGCGWFAIKCDKCGKTEIE